MSNFGTKIAFYNKNDELLYHCQNKWAHWIVSNNNDYDFVFWSDNNRAALFYEYKRNVSFEAILLDFDKNRTFRIDMAKFGYDLVSVFFEENFNLMNFMLLVSELKILEKPLIIEKFTSNIFSKWLPK